MVCSDCSDSVDTQIKEQEYLFTVNKPVKTRFDIMSSQHKHITFSPPFLVSSSLFEYY